MSQARMEVLAAPEMDVNADKGFNFSSSDNNFIVQKKNRRPGDDLTQDLVETERLFQLKCENFSYEKFLS